MSTNDNPAGGPPLHPRGTAAAAVTGAAAGTRSQSASGARTQSTSGSSSGIASGSAAGSGQPVQFLQSVEEQIPPHGYPSSLKLPTFWITRPESVSYTHLTLPTIYSV